jgi:hypothetical protein
LRYLRGMDWQQLLALLIVVCTAGLFLRGKLRKKRFTVEKDTHCGCGGDGPRIGPAQTIQFRARKGERAQVVVKNS